MKKQIITNNKSVNEDMYDIILRYLQLYTLMIWTEEEIGLIHCVVPDALDLSHDA